MNRDRSKGFVVVLKCIIVLFVIMGLVKLERMQRGVLRVVILCCNLLDKPDICIKVQRFISLRNAETLNLCSIEESIVALESILKHGFLHVARKM